MPKTTFIRFFLIVAAFLAMTATLTHWTGALQLDAAWASVAGHANIASGGGLVRPPKGQIIFILAMPMIFLASFIALRKTPVDSDTLRAAVFGTVGASLSYAAIIVFVRWAGLLDGFPERSGAMAWFWIVASAAWPGGLALFAGAALSIFATAAIIGKINPSINVPETRTSMMLVTALLTLFSASCAWRMFGSQDPTMALHSYAHNLSAYMSPFADGFLRETPGTPLQYGQLTHLLGTVFALFYKTADMALIANAISILAVVSVASAAMAALSMAIFTGRGLFAFAVFMGVVASVAFELPRVGMLDPYFQAQPGRILAPSIVLLLVSIIVRRNKNIPFECMAAAFVAGLLSLFGAEGAVASLAPAIFVAAATAEKPSQKALAVAGSLVMFIVGLALGRLASVDHAFNDSGQIMLFLLGFMSGPADISDVYLWGGIPAATTLFLLAFFSGRQSDRLVICAIAALGVLMGSLPQYLFRPNPMIFWMGPGFWVSYLFCAAFFISIRSRRAEPAKNGTGRIAVAAMALASVLFVSYAIAGLPLAVATTKPLFMADFKHKTYERKIAVMDRMDSLYSQAAREISTVSGERIFLTEQGWILRLLSGSRSSTPQFRIPEQMGYDGFAKMIVAVGGGRGTIITTYRFLEGRELASSVGDGSDGWLYHCMSKVIGRNYTVKWTETIPTGDASTLIGSPSEELQPLMTLEPNKEFHAMDDFLTVCPKSAELMKMAKDKTKVPLIGLGR